MTKRTSLFTWLAITGCILAITVTAAARTIHVDADATGANDGTSWEAAYFYLQDALMFAVAGDEIRVAQGVYRPDDFVLSDRPSLGRDETFQLINGVTLKGGYAGLGEPDPNARDMELYETILSGDLNGNDADVDDLEELADEPTRAENSYHVVTGSGTDATAILDGFTITGGNASGSGQSEDSRYGGGLFNGRSLSLPGSPTVASCKFHKNSAGIGGGMSCGRDCSAIVINCVFTANSAPGGSGMFNEGTPTLTQCEFSGNWAEVTGGGLENWGEPTLIDCMFIGNSTNNGCGPGGGGGLYSGGGGNPILTRCTFEENWSYGSGGGIYLCCSGRKATLTDCVFINNRSYRGRGGGGIY